MKDGRNFNGLYNHEGSHFHNMVFNGLKNCAGC